MIRSLLSPVLRSVASLCLLPFGLAVAAEIHVSPSGDDSNAGTAGAMLKTVSAAANLAQPGDTVTVHAGTYRERIDPPRGGTSDSNRIVYRAAPGEAVTIKGSEIVSGWQHVGNDTWSVTLPAGFFAGFNPFNNRLIADWFSPSGGRIDHSGAVYLNGHWLTEATAKATVLQAASATPQWFAEVNGGGYLMNVSWLQPFAGAAAGTRVDASWFDQDLGVINGTSSEGGNCVGYIEDGDWTRYANVDFGTGADTIQFRASSFYAGGRIEVHLDGPGGPLLGTCTVTGTGGWNNWQTFTANITPTSGSHTVCLVYRYPASASGETTIWAQFPGKNPNTELVEVNARQTVFYPSDTGRDFITVRGFTLEQAATPWSPPTAEQVGLIGTHWSKGWIIENNTVRYSVCSGISLGKYGDRWDNITTGTGIDGTAAYYETINRAVANGWNKATVGGHTVRDNKVSHCEQAGIVGSLGCSFSTVSGNEIRDIHVRKLFSGAEMANIKFHGAIDVQISHNHLHHGGSFGIWLDWMAQGAHVTGNLFHDNATDLFLEVNHGPILIDHNLFLSGNSIWDISEGEAYSHNLFAGAINSQADGRQTPYHPEHATAVSGLSSIAGGDTRFHNNILVSPSGLSGYNSKARPVAMDGNVFLNGAATSTQEASPLALPAFNPGLSLSPGLGGYYLKMNADPAWRAARTRPLVTTALLGNAQVPNVPFEQPDGSSWSLDTDQLGLARDTSNPFPGPFETVTQGLNVWKVFDDASVTAPTGLTASPGIRRVTLSWTSFIGATSYSVKRSTTGGGPYTTVASGLTDLTWTDTSVTAGTPYFYVITASDGVNEGAPSAEVTVTPSSQIAINCGAGASGSFAADAYYSAGGFAYASNNAVSTAGVTNPAPAAVYQSERWGPISYTIPGLTPGENYLVRLHFAEIYFNAPGGAAGGTGSRVFNVLVNGSAALSNFDIYAAAGGSLKAVVREVTRQADSQGRIIITLQAVVSNPKLSGFEIIAPNPDANANGILDNWETAHFGNANAGANLPGDDADKDGLSNLIEYALGTDPLAFNAGPAVDFETIAASKHLRLTVNKNPQATNLIYTVETCGELSDWSSVNTVTETNNSTLLIVRDTFNIASAPHRFIRLKVIAQP